MTVEAVGPLARLFGAAVGHQHRMAVTADPDTTVEGLLRDLAAQHPDFESLAFGGGGFTGQFQVIIGDRLLDLAGGFGRTLADGDVLVLLTPFEGG